MPILFLLDGFRRTRNALKEGESISKNFIKLIIGAYGFLLIAFSLMPIERKLNGHDLEVVIFDFFLPICNFLTPFLLATIFYKLGN